MATITNRLAFLISVNADQAIRAFDKTANVAERQLGKASSSVDKLGVSLTKFGAAGLAAAGTLSAGLYSMAQGAIEDQKAQALLAQQLRASTGATNDQIKSVEAMIDSMARASGIADDNLRPAMSNLVRATGSVTRAQKLLALSMDISRATGRDLQTVTIGIGRAANGQFGALTRLGIPIDEATKKSKDFNKVLDLLTKQFGGAASAYAETYAGKMERAKVAIDEAKESLGAGFVPVLENVSRLLNQGSTGFTKLDGATGGAIGKLTAFATVGLGTASALSLIAGQAIKSRNLLTTLAEDGTRQLTNMGRAARIAAYAISTIAISDALMSAINDASGSTDKLNKNMQTLLTVAGQTNRPVGDLTHSLGKMAEANAEALSLSHIWTDWGKKVQIVGFNVARPIEDIDAAYKKIMETSPEVAKRTLEDWKKQASALDKNSQQYKDNMMLIERYTEMLKSQTDAQKGLNQVLEDEADAAEKAAKAKAEAEAKAKALADAQEKLKTKVTSAAKALQSNLNQALNTAQQNLKRATDEFNAYQESISSSITSTLSFSGAQQSASKNVEDMKTATSNLATAQMEYNQAMTQGDPVAIATAFDKLTEAQKNLTAAQNTPKSFLASLRQQESAATTFAGNLQKLLNLGAKQGLIDQLAASGAEAGNAIATEILTSANPAQYVDQVNTIITNTQSIADSVGRNAATKFKQAGVDSANALLTGMNEVLSKAKIKLKFSNLNKKGKPIKTLQDLTDQLQNSITGLFTVGGFATADIPQLAQGGIVKSSPGGTLALLGEGRRDEAVIPLPSSGGLGGTNISITVQTGVGDPVAIGAAVVDVLQKYQSRTGSLPLKVR